jgi:NDP-sugar pyrophosphorylase family protein
MQSLIFLVFTAYWMITLLYCSPENYVKIKSAGMLAKFESVFYQRWSFFAPPADFNFRLYFEYNDKDSMRLSVYEILKPLARQKQLAAPFNAKEQFIDYIINSSVLEVNEILVTYFKHNKAEHPELSEQANYIEAVRNFNANAVKLSFAGYTTLKNYFNIHYHTFLKQDTALERACYGRIILAKNELPRFENRDSLLMKSYVPREMPVFQSTLLKL